MHVLAFAPMSQPAEQSPPDSPPRPRSTVLLWLERALYLVALVCLGSYAYVSLHARVVQHRAAARFEASLAAHRALPGDAGEPLAAPPGGDVQPAPTAVAGEPAPLHTGDIVGRLEVPRLGISVMVLEGDDDDTLRQAAGHIADTALPAAPGGNVGIAGHRDTFFRPLRNIRQGDEIRLTTERATYRYAVEATRIVSPDDVGVLAPLDHPVLTLVTCYPFYYVGHAPNRFIVTAREVP